MTDEENKAAARRFFEEGWNSGDPAQLKAFLADEFVSHNSLNFAIQSSDEYCRGVVAYRTAFPDLVTSVDDVIAEGDRVVVRGTDRGTHRAEFMGRAASGRFVTTTWIEIFRLESGKAVEGWVESDTKALMDQLDASDARVVSPTRRVGTVSMSTRRSTAANPSVPVAALAYAVVVDRVRLRRSAEEQADEDAFLALYGAWAPMEPTTFTAEWWASNPWGSSADGLSKLPRLPPRTRRHRHLDPGLRRDRVRRVHGRPLARLEPTSAGSPPLGDGG